MDCPFNNNNICRLASEIAQTKCATNESICQACNSCDRPKRLNMYTAGLVIENNPKQSMNDLVQIILAGNRGFGTTLATAFKPFFQELPDCECPGHQDILDTWTPEYISNNLEYVIRWLQTEAYRRSIKFSPMLCRIFLRTLLIIHTTTTKANSNKELIAVS